MAPLAAFHHPEPQRQVSDADRSRSLIYALGAAEQTLSRLSPSVLRAAGQNRAPLNRDDKLVAREVGIALREARRLVERLEAAEAALTGRG